MVDIKTATPLRWLKWFCTLIASIAIICALGIATNLAFGPQDYQTSSAMLAAVVAVVALAARNTIAWKLNDKR